MLGLKGTMAQIVPGGFAWRPESGFIACRNKRIRVWASKDPNGEWQSQWAALDAWLCLLGDVVPHHLRKEAENLKARSLL